MGERIVVTLKRIGPDGAIESIAAISDRAVVQATVEAMRQLADPAPDGDHPSVASRGAAGQAIKDLLEAADAVA